MTKFVKATLVGTDEDGEPAADLSVQVNVEQIAIIYPADEGGSQVMFAGGAGEDGIEHEFREPVSHFTEASA
ncbi:MAG: hypothetical protein ABL901_02735 [Hyphomicrobiaceae bacterium]|nr:hypothetical protein [Hyphomicrobiaceae bacterium]